jgi:hypothetical protein
MVNLQTGLSNLDWSADGNSIVVNSIGYELKFANVKDRKEMKAGEAKEINWNTWTCPLGWSVQGIYPGLEGFDVNTVCRSNISRSVLATGEEGGKIKLFSYPAIAKK